MNRSGLYRYPLLLLLLFVLTLMVTLGCDDDDDCQTCVICDNGASDPASLLVGAFCAKIDNERVFTVLDGTGTFDLDSTTIQIEARTRTRDGSNIGFTLIFPLEPQQIIENVTFLTADCNLFETGCPRLIYAIRPDGGGFEGFESSGDRGGALVIRIDRFIDPRKTSGNGALAGSFDGLMTSTSGGNPIVVADGRFHIELTSR